MHTQIIAEAGVNHNGSLERALELVRCAAEAGADTVKFQTFNAADLVSRNAAKARYQARQTGNDDSQLSMLLELQLSADDHRALQAACADHGIRFLSSAFDLASLRFLLDDLGVDTIKFGSGEITNAPLLYAAAQSGRDIILSSGMVGLSEIERALGVIALGAGPQPPAMPTAADFNAAWANPDNRARVRQRVALLHCTSQYPAPYESVNLRAMATLSTAFGLTTGYSDHTPGTTISEAAVALGARVIEKHLTTDRGLPGPDHAASLEPDEFAAMTRNIRAIEQALGDGIKTPSEHERDTAKVAQKSLVALVDIAAGEPFTEHNLGVKRPGGGIAPGEFWRYLGRTASRDFAADDLITESNAVVEGQRAADR